MSTTPRRSERRARGVFAFAAVASLGLGLLADRPAHAQTADGHELEYKTVEGRETPWRLTQATKGKVDMEGGPMGDQGVELGIDMTVDHRVTEKPTVDGKLVYEVGLDRLALVQTQNGVTAQDMDLSRSKVVVSGAEQPIEGNPQAAEMLKMFDGAAARVTMTASGTSVGTENLKPDIQGVDVGTIMTMMRPSFPEDGSSVAVGAKWKGTRPAMVNFELEEALVVDSEYELREVVDGVARIGVKGSVEKKDIIAKNPAGIDLELSTFKYEIEGECTFHIADGRVVKSELTATMTLDGRPGMGPPGMTMKMAMPSKFVLERIAKD